MPATSQFCGDTICLKSPGSGANRSLTARDGLPVNRSAPEREGTALTGASELAEGAGLVAGSRLWAEAFAEMHTATTSAIERGPFDRPQGHRVAVVIGSLKRSGEPGLTTNHMTLSPRFW